MSQVCSLSQADPRPRASHSVRAASIDCLHVDTRATNYANTDSTFRPMALRHQTFLIRSSVSITGPYRFTDTTAVWRYPIARPIPDALGSYPATLNISNDRFSADSTLVGATSKRTPPALYDNDVWRTSFVACGPLSTSSSSIDEHSVIGAAGDVRLFLSQISFFKLEA